MIRTFYLCLVFILTNSVMAQAALHPSDLGIARLEPNTWTATHAAQLELDGMEVVAALETVENEIQVPTIFTGIGQHMDTMVPLAPIQKQSFRIVLSAIENPALRARFSLEGKSLNINGEIHFAFISQNDNYDFQFVILAQEDGSYRAHFTRKLGQNDVEEGEFTLAPLPRILQK